MSTRRVHELASELGVNKYELVTQINGLALGFTVSNPMTALTDADVNTIRGALKSRNKAPALVETPAEPLADMPTTIVRRRAGKKKDAEPAVAAAPEAPPEPVMPQVRRRAGDDEEAKPAPAVAETVAAVVEKPAEPVEAPVVKPVVAVEAAPVVETPKVAEPVSTPEAVVVAKDVPAVVKTDAPPRRAPTPEKATVISTPAPGVSAPASRRTERPRGGAQIVGAISPTVLIERLQAEGKDFTPGPKNGRGKRDGGTDASGKRVVEGRDLYDAKSRRGNKRRQDKSGGRGRSQQSIQPAAQPQAEHKKVIRIEDAITVGDLAHQMGVKSGQVALKLMEMGMMANLNTMLDFDTATLIAEEFGYKVENVAFDITQFYDTSPDPEESLVPRPPVVTVMGHVDHGKTSLLDAIRSSTVASGEAGGITQHIGAYQVQAGGQAITFIDTPGHEAFTALRARGANSTDIVVLVVAADDGVMPQTVEAINHAQAAGVPIIVAVNKIDKEGANPDRVKQALTEYNLQPEEWGGKTLYVEVSAKARTNIEGLVDAIILQSEVEELRANPDRDAQGVVIESQLDVGRGPVATVLVQRGTLKPGDIIVSSQFYGRVRTMHDDRGRLVLKGTPSLPIEITGLGGVPDAGEPFFVVPDERDAKRITQFVQDRRKKEEMASRAKESSSLSLEDLSAMIQQGELKELKVIIKGDVQGSVEALKSSLAKLGNKEVCVKTIHAGVGGITENDVNLAASSASSELGAVIIGFNTRADSRANDQAEKYGVRIMTFNVIYDAIEEIRKILESMLSPIIEEHLLGHAEVRETFAAPKIGMIAGCYITDGLVRRNAKARLLRNGKTIHQSGISSLRRFKDDVKEVKAGFECGLSMDNYNDIRVGDIVEAFELKEVAATL